MLAGWPFACKEGLALEIFVELVGEIDGKVFQDFLGDVHFFVVLRDCLTND